MKKSYEVRYFLFGNYLLARDRFRAEMKREIINGDTVGWYNAATKKYELFPIEDEAHVDERRKAMGMEPLKDYLAMFGMKYAPAKK